MLIVSVGLGNMFANTSRVDEVTYNKLEEQIWQSIKLQLQATETGKNAQVKRIRVGYYQIIYKSYSSYQSSLRFIYEFKRLLEQPIKLDGQQYPVRFFFGVYECLGKEAESIGKIRSELALKYAKDQGKHRVLIYNHHIMLEIERELLIEQYMKESLVQKQFTLDFQPIYSLENNQLVGFEALVRWQHPILGVVSPGEFIPIAESSGVIHTLGDWIIEEACAEMNRIHKLCPKSKLKLSINISPFQLQFPYIIETACKYSDQYAINRQSIQFEVTEYAMQLVDCKIIENIRLLRDEGFNIAIDDFGTGYSSLESLSKLSLQCIKLDQLFIKQMENSKIHYAIVKNIIHLAHDIGVELIAEGVETKEQKKLVEDLGCKLVQGFYLSRPVPTSAIDMERLTQLLTI